MLNQHEQRQLRQIEQWFEETDPHLASGLRDCAGPTPPDSAEGRAAPALVTVATYTVALCLLVPGIVSFNLPLIFVGVVGLVAAGTAHINRRSEDE